MDHERESEEEPSAETGFKLGRAMANTNGEIRLNGFINYVKIIPRAQELKDYNYTMKAGN